MIRREPVAEPGPGEVLLEVRAAHVNPIDWRVYSGQMGDDPAALPMRLGREAAGVVAAVGPDVDDPAGRICVDDEVIAFRIADAYAELVVVGAGTVVPTTTSCRSSRRAGCWLRARRRCMP